MEGWEGGLGEGERRGEGRRDWIKEKRGEGWRVFVV